MIELPGRARVTFLRTSWLTLLLGTLIVILMVLQYQWANQIGTLAAESMERDLRVALRQVAGEVDHDLRTVLLDLSRPGAVRDSASQDSLRVVRLVLDSESQHLTARMVERSEADSSVQRFIVPTFSAGRRGTLVVEVEKSWLVDTLAPLLARRVSTAAELNATVAVRLGGTLAKVSGGVRSPASVEAPPDAEVEIFSPVVSPDNVFVLGSATAIVREAPAEPLQWSTARSDSASSGAGWTLVAWHEAGSLEAAAAQLRRGNLLLSFGVLGLLTLTGAVLIRLTRRETHAALERAAMLAGVSHELRTPLAVIRSAADNMRAGVVSSPGSVAEYGAIVMEHADRLGRAVEQSSDIARLIGGRRPLNPVRVSVAPTVAAALQLLEGAARVRIACGAVDVLHVDREVLEAVVRNLVENALAYSPAEEPVDVSFSRDNQDVLISVSDRGDGVPKREQRRIFDAFVRGDAAQNSRRAGLGLGLTLVAQLVARLGGDVQWQPRDGGGSTFVVRFREAS